MHPQSHSPQRPVMDVSPPRPPVLPAPVAGPPPVPDLPAPSPGHVSPPAPAPMPTPVPAPSPQEKPASEAMTVKQAPLANLEIEENNTPSQSAPMSGAELAEATKEVKDGETKKAAAATKKKAAPPGPKSPVAFVVVTVLFMVVLSGIAVAMYLTSQSS